MPQFLKDLYDKNKALAWIVGLVILPAIVLFFFKDIAMTFLAKGAQQDLNSAVKKDEELKIEIDSIKIDTAQHEAKANDLDKKANEVKADDEDWQKKRGNVKLTILAVLILLSASLYFIRFSYRTHYPIASVGDCVVFTDNGITVSAVVSENNVSQGSFKADGIVITPYTIDVFTDGSFPFSDIRDQEYQVLKDCK